MLENLPPHIPRPIRFLERWLCNGWTVKVYGITAQGEFPSTALIEQAKRIAQETLPLPAVTGDRHGIAILIVHEGADGSYIMVDWWFGVNMLKHVLYTSTRGSDAFQRDESGLAYCVWELEVINFERLAWLETVLKHSTRPDLEAYLNAVVNVDL